LGPSAPSGGPRQGWRRSDTFPTSTADGARRQNAQIGSAGQRSRRPAPGASLADPTDRKGIHAVEEETGLKIRVLASTDLDITAAITRYYRA